MTRMPSRRFRPWLVLAAVAALGSCDLNPQPPLPENGPAMGGSRGMLPGGENTAGTSAPSGPGTAGSLSIDAGGQSNGGTTPSVMPEPSGGQPAGGEGAGGDGDAGAGAGADPGTVR